MTDKTFEARVAEIARRRGIIIKQASVAFVARKVAACYLHGSLDMISDGEVFANVAKLLAEFPTQFGDPSPLLRKSPEQRLEEANAKTAALVEKAPPAIPGKIERASMTDKERSAFDSMTVDQKLSYANEKAAEFLAKKAVK